MVVRTKQRLNSLHRQQLRSMSVRLAAMSSGGFLRTKLLLEAGVGPAHMSMDR